jgi:uncharacterized phage-like protein YoqJ
VEGGTNTDLGVEVDTNWTAKELEKGYRRINMAQILCTHEYKWKNDTY